MIVGAYVAALGVLSELGRVRGARLPDRMHLATYIGLLHTSLSTLADAFRQVGQGHPDEADVVRTCEVLATRINDQANRPRRGSATTNFSRSSPPANRTPHVSSPGYEPASNKPHRRPSSQPGSARHYRQSG
jgi:hypothetical protein